MVKLWARGAEFGDLPSLRLAASVHPDTEFDPYPARQLPAPPPSPSSPVAVPLTRALQDPPTSPPSRLPARPLLQGVVVVGYPTGGDNTSVTSGVVSRVEVAQYAHAASHLMACQIDAAINPGNSGEGGCGGGCGGLGCVSVRCWVGC